jgi:molecular chaperone GrpE
MEENTDLEKDIEKQNQEVKEEKKFEKPKKNKINKELEALKEENKNLQDKVLRTTAEMQNMRRRQEEEISRIRKYEGDDILKKLLPIIDNFERAIKLDDNDLTDELSKFLSGFKMIYTNLISVLEEKEVKEIVCKDQEFDSSLMEAVLTEHVDGIEKNQVLEVLQKGYTYKDKLLRPAMVKVSE